MFLISFLITLVFFGSGKNIQNDLKKSAEAKVEKAKSLYNNSEFEKALKLYQEADELYKEGGFWNESINCINKQGLIYDKQGKLKKRNLILNNGLYLSKKNMKEKLHPGTALLYRQKGEVMIGLGKFDSASFYLSEAKIVFEKSEKWSDYVNTLIIESVVSYYQGNFVEMQQILNNALNSSFKNIPAKDNVYPSIFQLLGVCNETLGDYEEALDVAEKTIKYYLQKKKITSGDSSRLNANYHNIGMLYFDKGDYSHAIEYLSQSIFYLSKKDINKYNKNLADYFSSLGIIQLRKNNYNLALKSYLKADSLSPLPSQTSSSLKRNIYTGIATIYRQKQDYNRSLKYSLKAKEYDPKNKSALIPSNLGQSYLYLKKKNKALKHLEEALSMTIKKYGSQHPETSKRLLNLGKAYKHLGDKALALEYFQKSLEALNLKTTDYLFDGVSDKVVALEALKLKGNISLDFYNINSDKVHLNTALTSFKTAMHLIDNMRFEMKAEGSKLALQEHTTSIIEGAISSSLIEFKISNDSSYVKDAFEFAEKGRAMILLEELVKNNSFKFGNIPDSLYQKENTLQINLSFYRKKYQEALNNKDSSKLKIYQSYLFQAKNTYNQLIETLKSDYPNYYNIKFLSPNPSIQSLSEKLSPEGLFIEYFIGQNNIYAFTIQANKKLDIYVIKKPEDFNQIIERVYFSVKDYNQAIHNGKESYQQFIQSSSQLYQLILKPLIENKGFKQLYIVPHSNLSFIPFEVLLTEFSKTTNSISYNNLPYLVKDYIINYQYSGYLFQQQNSNEYSSGKVLAFAPGSFNGNNNQDLLPATLKEIKEIETYFSGNFYTSKQASKEKFINEAEKYNILHLATHGFSETDKPLSSYILFSKSDKKQEDKLFAFELSALDLNADLAVLTSCQSGYGKHYEGEGVYSFARSFSYAGVKSIIMSLWNLEDNASSEIVSGFYKNLAEGKSKDQALQQSKVAYINNSDPFKSHPSFWAGLVQIGSNAKIENSNNSTFKQIMALGMILFPLIIIMIIRRNKRK